MSIPRSPTLSQAPQDLALQYRHPSRLAEPPAGRQPARAVAQFGKFGANLNLTGPDRGEAAADPFGRVHGGFAPDFTGEFAAQQRRAVPGPASSTPVTKVSASWARWGKVAESSAALATPQTAAAGNGRKGRPDVSLTTSGLGQIRRCGGKACATGSGRAE